MNKINGLVLNIFTLAWFVNYWLVGNDTALIIANVFLAASFVMSSKQVKKDDK